MKKRLFTALVACILVCACLFALAACDKETSPTNPPKNEENSGNDQNNDQSDEPADPCANGHTEVVDSGKDATCTETGLTEGKHCSVCSKVLVAQTVIEKLGHNYVSNVCTRCESVPRYSEGLEFIHNGDGTCHVRSIGTCKDKDVYIPPVSPKGWKITSIHYSAFFKCSNLTSITIPDSVTTIYSSTFSKCSNLTSITIPDSVTSIGDYSFLGCSSLTSITIPDSVTRIGNSAFHDCTSLTSITLSKSLTSIGDGAFYDCTSLTNITFGGSVAEWNAIWKRLDWNYKVPATEVICSDGEVKLQ